MPEIQLVRDSDQEVVGRVLFDWANRREFLIENVRTSIPRPLYRFTVQDNLRNPNLRKPAGGIGVIGVGKYYEVLNQVMLDAERQLRGISVRFPIEGKLPVRIIEADSAPLVEG